MGMDDVIDLMRSQVRVEMVQASGNQTQLTAFKVVYSAGEPRIAQRVTNELTSLFIEANVRDRTQQSINTTQFLENQLEEAHKNLLQQEQQLRDYKTKYLGELPEQEAGNLQILGSLESQLQISASGLERAEQQKIYLESVMTQYRNLKKAVAKREPPASANPALVAAEARLGALEARLSESRSHLKDAHPEVTALQQQVAEAQAATEKLRAAARTETADQDPAAANNDQQDMGLIEAESRLKSIVVEIESRKTDTARLRERIEELQRRVSIVPMREQQLTEVTRNYENSKLYYQSLLQKKLGSELATNLEKRQQAEQFRVLDPASLPQKPSQANRFAIVALGWALGLGCGLVLAVVRELTDTSLHDAADVVALTSACVLGRIPVMHSNREKLRIKFRWGLEAVSVLLLALFSLGTALQTYVAG